MLRHRPFVLALATLSSWTSARRSTAAFFGRGAATSPAWARRSGATSSRCRASCFIPRGGDGDVAAETDASREASLDDRVNAAMRRLGLETEDDADAADDGSPPPPLSPPSQSASQQSTDNADEPTAAAAEATPATPEDVPAIAERLASELSVPRDLVLAALYASGGQQGVDEGAARAIVREELNAVAGVDADLPAVQELVEEGFEVFYARRALAIAEGSVDNARAMLLADREDEEAARAEGTASEEEAAAREDRETPMRTVTVEPPQGFDPFSGAAALASSPPKPVPAPAPASPVPAKREDVIFEGTSATLQELVVESPVPVLLDVYADWCGPCKQLTPALEQICINAGGALRLVKVDTDAERQISAALEVKSLPTVFGIKEGKILHSFLGLPRDEATIRNFLMGLLVPGHGFQPPVTEEEQKRYDDLTGKLLQLAASGSFSFADRERLENHVTRRLDDLAEAIGDEAALDSARVLRSLVSNVAAHPFEERYRQIKLDNKVIAARVAPHPPCVSILRSLGFVPEDGPDRTAASLVVGRGKRVANVAPFAAGRGSLDRWMEKRRHKIATDGRRRRDELERARLSLEEAAASEEEESEAEEATAAAAADDRACVIHLRLEGKKKVHEITLDVDDTLATLRDRLPFPVGGDGDVVRFTCAARRLVVDSSDAAVMSRTLAELRLAPTSSVAVKIITVDAGEGGTADAPPTAAAAERGGLAARRTAAATKKKKGTGTHSMHSIGLYAKDDGSKAETFESGGVLYDHVLTDDEDDDEDGEADKSE